MLRIDARTVQLTEVEMAVLDYFEDLLTQGYGITDAARQALEPALPWVGGSFVVYLSDGTLRLAAGSLQLA